MRSFQREEATPDGCKLWPLLIDVRGSTTASSSVEINSADGEPVAWTLQSLPARAGRFTWVVAPDQTQSAPPGNYTTVVRYGKAADSESIIVRLTLTAATEAITDAQRAKLPYLTAAYHIRRGDTAAAKRSTDDALKAAPTDIGLLILRGDVLMASTEYSAAVDAYTKAMDARAALVKEEDDDGPPVLLTAKLREAIRLAGPGKELLNTKHD